MKILLAVDGSRHSLDAVACVIEHADWYRKPPQIELVTVQLPVPKLPRMRLVVGKGQIQKYYDEEGGRHLAAAKKKLAAAGLRFQARILVGSVAESIVSHARSTGCDLICIGDRGRSEVGKMLIGSTATKLMQLSHLPVLLVK